MFIGAAAIMDLMRSQTNELARLNQKITVLDLAREVRNALNNSSVCSFNLSSGGTATFDASGIPLIGSGTRLATALLNPTALYESSIFSSRKIANTGLPLPGNNTPKVVSISVINWAERAPNEYITDLIIRLSSNYGAMAPMMVTGIIIGTSGPTSTKSITSCSTGSTLLTVGSLSISASLPYSYSYLGSKQPVILTGYTYLPGAGSSACHLQAEQYNASGAILKPWYSLAATNPAWGPDGGSFMNTGFNFTVIINQGATVIAFRASGGCGGGGQNLFLHSLIEQ